jgi:hypothetical protein
MWLKRFNLNGKISDNKTFTMFLLHNVRRSSRFWKRNLFLVRLDSSNAVAASITDYENQWIWVVKSTKAIVPVKFSDFPVGPVFQESIQTSCRPTLSLWLPVCFRASSWCRNIRERIFYYMDHICGGNKLSFKVMSNLWGGEQELLLLVHQLKVKW